MHDKIYVGIYLKIFGCIVVLYYTHIRFIIWYLKCFMFIPLACQNEKHERQYLAKGSVSSKYRVEPQRVMLMIFWIDLV